MNRMNAAVVKKNEGEQWNSVRRIVWIFAGVVLCLMVLGVPGREQRALASVAGEGEVIQEGIFFFEVDQSGESLIWIGCRANDGERLRVLSVPEQVEAGGNVYPVTGVDISWRYYFTKEEEAFCDGVEEIVLPETVTGEVVGIPWAFPNLVYLEFLSDTPPERVELAPNPLIIVPEGARERYQKELQYVLNYYWGSDLSEKDEYIPADVAESREEKVERSFFVKDGRIYQVMKKAGGAKVEQGNISGDEEHDEDKGSVGTVSLLGVTERQPEFLALAGEVEHDGYRYQLTKLTTFSLYHSGARTVVLPDTITEMESAVFGHDVEILYLSANCPVVPRNLVVDEWEIGLKYVHVPRGVTTLSDYAFRLTADQVGFISLPDTLQRIGKEALVGFRIIRYGTMLGGLNLGMFNR